jgi:acyl dehydratase
MFYGYNRVRFPEPVPVGARVRLHADVAGVEDLGVAEQLVVDLRVECEGTDRPACVAQAVFRHYRVAAPA